MNGYVVIALKNARRIVITVIGATIILLGVVGMLLPVMPGFIFIPLGLAILATEFVWAKHWLNEVKRRSRQVTDAVTGKRHTGPAPPSPSPKPVDLKPDRPSPH